MVIKRWGYARVSTKTQEIDSQINVLLVQKCDYIFIDKGYSGANVIRPEYQRMKEQLREGDKIYIKSIDRLGRNMRELINEVEEINHKGVEIISLTENIDTTTIQGKFFFYVISLFAEVERKMISERTKSGLRAAKERGVRLGRKKGYNDEQIKKIKSVQALANKNLSVKDICKIIGISKTTYYRYIKL